MNEDTIPDLILQELKLIREEMKEEIRRLCKSLQFFYFDKSSKSIFDSKQDFSGNEESSLQFVNNITNYSNDAIVKTEPIADLTESLLNHKSCISRLQPEPTSENFDSDNLEMQSQLQEVKLVAENTEHEIPSIQPVVGAKSVFKSKSSFSNSILQGSDEVENTLIIQNYNFKNHTCQENNPKTFFSTLDKNNITHTISNESMVNFNCKLCLQSFSNSLDYLHHMEAHADTEHMLHDRCSSNMPNIKLSFSSDGDHHNKKTEHICRFCNKSLPTNCLLIAHMRIHNGERPYKCNICNKHFKQKSHLVTHARIHTGEKPYKCSICNKRFNQNSSLTNHIRIHTGEKPFKCSECSKRFSDYSNLLKHARVHSK